MKTLSAQQSCICDEECDIQVKEDGPGPIIVPIMSPKKPCYNNAFPHGLSPVSSP